MRISRCFSDGLVQRGVLFLDAVRGDVLGDLRVQVFILAGIDLDERI